MPRPHSDRLPGEPRELLSPSVSSSVHCVIFLWLPTLIRSSLIIPSPKFVSCHACVPFIRVLQSKETYALQNLAKTSTPKCMQMMDHGLKRTLSSSPLPTHDNLSMPLRRTKSEEWLTSSTSKNVIPTHYLSDFAFDLVSTPEQMRDEMDSILPGAQVEPLKKGLVDASSSRTSISDSHVQCNKAQKNGKAGHQQAHLTPCVAASCQEVSKKQKSTGFEGLEVMSCDAQSVVHVSNPSTVPAKRWPELVTPALRESSTTLGCMSANACKFMNFAVDASMDDIDVMETPMQQKSCLGCNLGSNFLDRLPQDIGPQGTPLFSAITHEYNRMKPGMSDVTHTTLDKDRQLSYVQPGAPVTKHITLDEDTPHRHMQLQGTLLDAPVCSKKRQLVAQAFQGAERPMLSVTPLQAACAPSDICPTIGYPVDSSHLYKRRR
jgi:hypothetical protein